MSTEEEAAVVIVSKAEASATADVLGAFLEATRDLESHGGKHSRIRIHIRSMLRNLIRDADLDAGLYTRVLPRMSEEPETHSEAKPRVPGRDKGQIWMSDDFDAPLELVESA